MTLFASKCDHLDRAMLLLAFLDSPSVFFVLAMIGIVDCTFRRLPIASLRPVPFPFICTWNGHFTSVWTGQNGTETSPFFLAATVLAMQSVDNSQSSGEYLLSSLLGTCVYYRDSGCPNIRQAMVLISSYGRSDHLTYKFP